MIHKDEVRQDRIFMEVVVDAYDEEEIAMGWYYYLDDKINSTFTAKYIKVAVKSSLLEGEKVTVVQLAPADECN